MMSLSLSVLLESVSKAESKLKGKKKRGARSGWSQRFNYFNYLPSFSFPKKEAIKGCPFGLIWLKKQDGGRDESLHMSVLIRGVKTAICELGRLLKWVESACSVSVFLNAFFLTSKHLLPAGSVDKLLKPTPCLIPRRALKPSWQQVGVKHNATGEK